MDLVLLYREVSKRIWLLLLISLLAGLTTFLLTRNFQVEYTSHAQLSTGYTIKDANNQNINMSVADVQFDNLVETILSDQVVAQTSYQLLIHDLTDKNPYTKTEDLDEETIELVNGIGKSKVVTLLEEKVNSLSILQSNNALDRNILRILEDYGYDYKSVNKRLEVLRVGKTDYVDIFAKTDNPEESAQLVNSLTDNFLRFTNNVSTARNTGSLDTLKEQVNEKRLYLSQKQQELTNFKSALGILNLESSGSSKIDLIGNFEQTLDQEKRALQQVQAEAREVNTRLRSLGSDQSNISSDLLTIRSQINELEAEYQRTRNAATLTRLEELKRRRDNLAASSNIEGLRYDRELERDLKARLSELNAKIYASRRNISSLQSRISALSSNVSSYAGKEAEIRAMEQEVELAKADYEAISKRYNDANTFAATSGNIRSSLVGQVPLMPNSSQRYLIVAAAAVATFILGLIIIILATYFDFSTKNPTNFSKITRIPVLGSVPSMPFNKNKNEFFIDDNAINGSSTRGKHFDNLLHKLRYEIESTGCKIILLTSTKDQEGKTTLLSLLSSIYKKTNKRILIIDSNFANNEITEKLDITPNTNSRFLMGHLKEKRQLNGASNSETTVAELNHSDAKPSISQTIHQNIDIIGCKDGYHLPHEHFPDHEPLNKFKDITKHYDYVYIEGPSLNNYPDSKELAKYVDGVILVSSVESQIKYMDKESMNFLKGLGDKFLGAILNKVSYADLN